MRSEQMRLGWGSMLGAASLAMALASVVWKIDGTQSYRDFVVGHIAWGASSKTIDYWGLAVFLGLFALFVFGACKLFTLLNERGDNSLVDALDRLFLVAVVPAGWWVASDEPGQWLSQGRSRIALVDGRLTR